ncbi:hypothetical protein [Arthrobacter sp. U41]|uniref:hypothetical protein n=1 Tax=Arthrobacter sp. U41 TaxID=1849032 RepID=UPI0008596B0C|nr:hypothetical protein [Arthrobacter sp. U41]AOT03249.1 hypothetical protein ASPU41_07750 [Arthrobacter sp. U41]
MGTFRPDIVDELNRELGKGCNVGKMKYALNDADLGAAPRYRRCSSGLAERPEQCISEAR